MYVPGFELEAASQRTPRRMTLGYPEAIFSEVGAASG
jgi:hypothetical protein